MARDSAGGYDRAREPPPRGEGRGCREQIENAREIVEIAASEGETRALNDFPILGDVACQYTNAGGHGIEQSQGQALQFGGQHEDGSIREQGFKIAAGNPGEETDAAGFVAPQAFDVRIGMTGTSGKDQLHIRVDSFEGLDEEVTVFLGRKPSEEQDVLAGENVPLSETEGMIARRGCAAIGDVKGFAMVVIAVIALERFAATGMAWRKRRESCAHTLN